MAKVKLFKQDGTVAGDVELNQKVFGVEPNESVIFEAVMMQRAGMRQGTHKTKTRAEVRGGGRKPWRQKGTGRARSGSTRSPIWVGGGVTFGPQPRSYGYNLPKKMRHLALTSALSMKANEDAIVVVDALTLDAPKTKDFQGVLNNLNVDEKTLLILEGNNDNVYLSARNIPNVKVIDDRNVNVLDVVAFDKIIITQDALSTVEEALA